MPRAGPPSQPWSDGRLAIYGGSYGGYLVLCALVEEPAMWRAGVDLYGDSEIAESYRHGDRLGPARPAPDDGLARRPDRGAELYRRGSPVYRAERIEAPLLILHGRKDKRVVPLMTERMVEALEIEGKHHEVHWYDDEGHGWERRENRRDAFTRILRAYPRGRRTTGATAARHRLARRPDVGPLVRAGGRSRRRRAGSLSSGSARDRTSPALRRARS